MNYFRKSFISHRHLSTATIVLWIFFVAACSSSDNGSVNTAQVTLDLPTISVVDSTEVEEPAPESSPLPTDESTRLPEATPNIVEQITDTPESTDPLPIATFTLSPDIPHGRIVYVCQVFRDGDRDQICLMNADGSGQQRLTTDDRTDFNYPSFAPDGESIVFAGKNRGEFEIYEMHLGNRSTVRLNSIPGRSYAPAISPGGDKIVYTYKPGNTQAVWVMDRDGSNAYQVFGPPQGEGWDPVWSPDGSQILFASDMSGSIQLYTIDSDGGNLRKVTQQVGLRGRSDWSPDGDTIATYAGESWLREIFLMDLSGGNLSQLTNGGNNLAPSYSPDGNWITFTSYLDNYRDDHGCEIYIMRLDGSQLTRLTDNAYCDWQPHWGP